MKGESNVFCPFANYNRIDPRPSYIRILHASPRTPSVDVYVNDKKTVSNLSYEKFTEYYKLPAGSYNIKLYTTRTKVNPILNKNLNLPSGKIFTIAAIGTYPNLSLLPINEPIGPIMPNKSLLRFVHLSPNSPKVDLALKDGKVLFKNVAYKEVTDYVPVNPGIYNFEIKPAGTAKAVLYIPNIRLLRDRFYTIYAVGLLGERPPLQVLIPLDGNSYIKF